MRKGIFISLFPLLTPSSCRFQHQVPTKENVSKPSGANTRLSKPVLDEFLHRRSSTANQKQDDQKQEDSAFSFSQVYASLFSDSSEYNFPRIGIDHRPASYAELIRNQSNKDETTHQGEKVAVSTHKVPNSHM